MIIGMHCWCWSQVHLKVASYRSDSLTLIEKWIGSLACEDDLCLRTSWVDRLTPTGNNENVWNLYPSVDPYLTTWADNSIFSYVHSTRLSNMSSPTVNKIPTLVPSIDEVVTGMISADISRYVFLLVCHGDLLRNLQSTMFSEGGGRFTLKCNKWVLFEK